MRPLPAALADELQRAPLDERLAAARALGADDPRIGAQAEVPAGDLLAGHERAPARTGAFQIDLLPITNSQFAKFIEAGYRDRALWSDEGWEWRLREAVERPRFWGDPAWAAYHEPGQPVVGASYFEAEAYARFAGRRLPEPLEWERAARGEDGGVFPWGDAWDPMKAHHRGGPRQTLPAGCFPAGKSPHGLYDAAGNVWEWCRGGGALRPARGGSWNAHPPQLRCAGGNAWPPAARFSNIGFRTAR